MRNQEQPTEPGKGPKARAKSKDVGWREVYSKDKGKGSSRQMRQREANSKRGAGEKARKRAEEATGKGKGKGDGGKRYGVVARSRNSLGGVLQLWL